MGTGKTLSGKVAVITGGSRGIGAAIAKRFAAEGANVAIIARTATPGGKLKGSLSETAEAIKAQHILEIEAIAAQYTLEAEEMVSLAAEHVSEAEEIKASTNKLDFFIICYSIFVGFA